MVDEKMLEEMVGFMEKDSDIGMLSPVILYNKSHRIWFCGGELNRNTGLLYLWSLRKEWSVPANPTVRLCSFLAGCALLVRTDVFNSIKGLHEEYFLTSEESELCVRIADLGYKLGVYEGSVLYHKVSMSMGVGSPLQVYFLYRNKLFFVKRNAKYITVSDFIAIINYYLCGIVLNALKGKLSLSLAIMRGVKDFLLQRDGLGYYKGRL